MEILTNQIPTGDYVAVVKTRTYVWSYKIRIRVGHLELDEVNTGRDTLDSAKSIAEDMAGRLGIKTIVILA